MANRARQRARRRHARDIDGHLSGDDRAVSDAVTRLFGEPGFAFNTDIAPSATDDFPIEKIKHRVAAIVASSRPDRGETAPAGESTHPLAETFNAPENPSNSASMTSGLREAGRPSDGSGSQHAGDTSAS
ncbi:MAG: hypothetical protein AAF709_13100, partial [Pseudomonadota bacterium]